MSGVLVAPSPVRVPALLAAAGERGRSLSRVLRVDDPRPHMRRAFGHAVADFLAWCADQGVRSVTEVQPLHVAAWVEAQKRERAALIVKLRLAVLRFLLDGC